MKANVLIFSPRYIQRYYVDFLLKAMNIHKIYSFLNKHQEHEQQTTSPFDSLFKSLELLHEKYPGAVPEIKERTTISEDCYALSPGAQQRKEITEDEYWDFVKKIIEDIKSLLETPVPIGSNSNRILERPTIAIIADWQPLGRYLHSNERHFQSYDLLIKDNQKNHLRWSSIENTAFPYNNEFGDLSEHIAIGLNEALSSNGENDLINDVSLIKTAVFFEDYEQFSLTYNYSDASWGIKNLRNKLNGKIYSFTSALRLRAANLYPDVFVCHGPNGKKILIDIHKETTKSDMNLWIRDNHLEREFYDEEEYMAELHPDDNDNHGCGYGWSCTNCPNYGCPSNEMN